MTYFHVRNSQVAPPLGWIREIFFDHSLDKGLISKLLSRVLLISPLFMAQGVNANPILDQYVDQALAKSPLIRQANLEVQAEVERLNQLRGRFYPTLNLQARVSVAEGGRTIDFPAGDLLNPVYQTLNQQAVANGQPARFPTIENQSIPLLRPQEQDTRLQLKGPVYEPALDAQIAAQNSLTASQQSARDQARDELVRDLKVAYWRTAQAQAKVEVLSSSLKTLEENERVNQSLYKVGEVTLDAPKRAQAERLEIQVSLQEAQAQEKLARQFFNLLRMEPINAPIDLPGNELQGKTVEEVALQLSADTAAAEPSPALMQLEQGIAARQSGVDAAKATYKPSIGYAVEAGYSGRDYSTGPNTGFAMASVVLNWTLADGSVRRSEVSRAQAQLGALQARKEHAERQVLLAKIQARSNLDVSLKALNARLAQREAAEETLRILTGKRDVGEATQIEFLSAEQSATRARLGLVNALHQARIDYAVWQFNNKVIAQEISLAGEQ